MFSEFFIYVQLGIQHILDVNAIDHMLFLLVLTASIPPMEWRKLLVLITAFTLGHSITLALAVLRIVEVPGNYIEFLIPVTIFVTGVLNIVRLIKNSDRQRYFIQYALAMFFGLIHGLGFSNYLLQLLGRENGLFVQLFGFNLGVEAGQIIIVSILAVIIITANRWQIRHRLSSGVISFGASIFACYLMYQTKFW